MGSKAVMALSGGMDSTSLLLRLLRDGHGVTCVSYEYGQKHSIEIKRAKENIQRLQSMGMEVSHKVIDLSSAMGTFHSALTNQNYEVPEGHYEEIQMKQTVVPNRNAIFSSILYGMALSISQSEDKEVIVAWACIVVITLFIQTVGLNSTKRYQTPFLWEIGSRKGSLLNYHTLLVISLLS